MRSDEQKPFTDPKIKISKITEKLDPNSFSNFEFICKSKAHRSGPTQKPKKKSKFTKGRKPH